MTATNEKQIQILYHVSFDPVKKFVLRVPRHRCPGEDSTTKRICLSEEVNKAITAMAGGGQALRGMLRAKNKITPILHIYMCEADASFIPPEDVQNMYHVVDAVHNREWWAIKIPKFKHRIINVLNAEFKQGIDIFGNVGVAVKSMDYDLIQEIPKNAPQEILSEKEIGYSVRECFHAFDRIKRT